MLIASGLLALVIGAAFAVLLSSVSVIGLRAAERRARQSEEVLVVANRLERLVVDLEPGQRRLVITGQERFLRPWQDTRNAFPATDVDATEDGRRRMDAMRVDFDRFLAAEREVGGTIEVHSPAGQGTSLQIDLPIHGGDHASS